MTSSAAELEAQRRVHMYQKVAQSLSVGVAVVDPDTWEIDFENAKFFTWFPPVAGDDGNSIASRIEDFPMERVVKRIEAGRSVTFETEVKDSARTIPLSVSVTAITDEDSTVALVECTDVSKEREATYMLESYSKLAEHNAKELETEKERVERLLLNVMPRSVFEELKDLGTTTPQRFESVTVLMLDFVGFTEMTISQDPSSLLSELNDIFSAFDQITDTFGAERIKTIGDAYMAVSGIPEQNPDHAHNVAKVALRMRRYLEKRNAAHPQQWTARMGIHTGPVIGSLVGITKYVYDLFGPGVNLASRLEALSEPMRITISHETYDLIKDDFDCSERGDFEIKGFGTRDLFYLDSERVVSVRF